MKISINKTTNDNFCNRFSIICMLSWLHMNFQIPENRGIGHRNNTDLWCRPERTALLANADPSGTGHRAAPTTTVSANGGGMSLVTRATGRTTLSLWKGKLFLTRHKCMATYYCKGISLSLFIQIFFFHRVHYVRGSTPALPVILSLNITIPSKSQCYQHWP